MTLNREIKVFYDNKAKGGKKRFKVLHLNDAVTHYCKYWVMWINAGSTPKRFFDWLETEVKSFEE